MKRCLDCERLMDLVYCCVNCGDQIHFECKCADLERLPAERRWIPVEERLPELGIEVLVYLIDSKLCVQAWRDTSDGEWASFDRLGIITHWMPLPPLPDHIGNSNEKGAQT